MKITFSSRPLNFVVALLLGMIVLASTIQSAGKLSVKPTWTLSVPFCCGHYVLEDLSQDGSMLVNDFNGDVPGPASGSREPKLLLWRVGTAVPTTEIPFPEIWNHSKTLSENMAGMPPGPFYFNAHSQRILGVRPPWIIIRDVRTEKGTRFVSACGEVGGMNEPDSRVSPKTTAEHWMLIAPNPQNGSVAVACNTENAIQIVILDLENASKTVHLPQPEPVEDLAWSPDGNILAVLYYTPPRNFDSTGIWESKLADAPPSTPTVALFDLEGRKELRRFNTGSFDAKISFDPSGASLYAISHARLGRGYSDGDWQKESLRKFDIATGRLVRRFMVEGTGVRQNFVISTNGELIAADCTVNISKPFLSEQVSLKVKAGFVLLDSRSGQVLFRETRNTLGEVSDQLPMFFGDGDHRLVVNFRSTGAPRDNGKIVAFSISRR